MALKNMSRKKEIKIVVTDSGLGGLFIMAVLAERLRLERQFQKAKLVFFNCRPAEKAGYDNMRANAERSIVFSEALRFMNNYYNPDVILIACNTLSAIYGQTAFSSNAPLPVLGIIQDGVNEISGYLRHRNDSSIIMFASPTTVESSLHKKLLIEKGVNPERLIYQECPGLPGLIDKNGPADRKTCDEIARFMHAAVSKTQNRSFAAALLCTHFGLVSETFACAGAEYKNFTGDVINPNSLMVEKFLGNFKKGAHTKTDISISVDSMTEHSQEMKTSLLPHVEKISPDTAQALRKTKYHADNEVFSGTVRAALKKRWNRQNSRVIGKKDRNTLITKNGALAMNSKIIINNVVLYLCRIQADVSYSTDNLTEVNSMLVELRSDGLSGWGEVFLAKIEPLWSWAKRVAPLIKGQNAGQLDDLIEKWPEDRPKMEHKDCYTYCHEDVDSVAEAFSIALHDLVARAKGIPFGALLGKIERTSIPGMPVITLAKPSVMAEQARGWAEAGYRYIKVKLSGNEGEDIERVEAVCKNTGSGVKLQVDANGIYPDMKAASKIIDVLNKQHIEVVEDLFDVGNVDLCRKVCDALECLYMIDKDSYWPHVKTILRHKAADLINQHPHNQGRMSYVIKIAQAVHAAGLENAIGSSGIFGIQNTAFQHLASITGLTRPCEDIGNHNYFNGPLGNVSNYTHSPCLLKQPFPIVKGNIQLSQTPGLGVEIDRSLLQKVTVEKADA